MDQRGRTTILCGVSIAIALLGCNDPANDRPEVLANAAAVPANDDGGPGPAPERAPPPILGGTLLVARDGHTVVASDPDGDRIWVADTRGLAQAWSVPLEAGAEPGRVVEDGARRVHVALRGAGAVLTLDLSTSTSSLSASGTGGASTMRRAVCASPRGIAWNPVGDVVHVACAGGELVTLPAAGGAPSRRTFVARDLRDVVVSQGLRYVTRFRSAEVLQLDAADRVLRRTLGAAPADTEEGGDASVAWRALPLSRGGAMVLHQRATTAPLRLGPAGYTADLPCGAGVVQSAVSVVKDDSRPATSLPLRDAVLAVDVALDPRGEEIAVAAPGRGQVLRYRFDRLYSNVDSGCVQGRPMGAGAAAALAGESVAVAFAADGRLVVQTRSPAAIHVLGTAYDDDRGGEIEGTVALGAPRAVDPGHRLFHADTGAGIACASCHPEGEDDGRVWRFEGVGARRTQTLRGGLLATAPFNWEGDAQDLRELTHRTYATQMLGGGLSAAQVDAAVRWLDALPAVARSAPRDERAIAEGRALFRDPAVGCAGCHSGERLTNNENRDVGTDGAFQVPSLVDVAARGPWLHDGRAATLSAAVLAGGAHGGARHLDAERLAALLAYVETL
jgi:cytochrome c peroxidase/DNA-binding beta-propeller fold protein YncE